VKYAVRRNPRDRPECRRYSAYIPQALIANNHQEHIMNIAKNMEAIFVAAAFVLLGATGMATASTPAQVTLIHADSVTTPVVMVTGHRMSAAEKAAAAE